MPRTGALLALSREHHASLVMARNARRIANENETSAGGCLIAIDAALASVEAHWHSVMAGHLEQEERLIAKAKDMLDPAAVARILAEHAELRMLAAGPCALEPAARLRRFAQLVSTHVRYEERTFFPQLQTHPCVADFSSDTQAETQVDT